MHSRLWLSPIVAQMLVFAMFRVGVRDLHLVMDAIQTMFFVIVAAYAWLGLIVFAIRKA